MKIAAVADLHEHLLDIEPCDVLVIAGDIGFSRHGDVKSECRFLDGPFREWLRKVPAEYIIGVAGNHDFAFERVEAPVLPWIYLEDSGIEIDGVNFWGTPWQPPFFDWAFNLSEEQLAHKFARIPQDTHVLIAHGPPKNYGDRTQNRYGPPEHVGSEALLRRINDVLPEFVICGHVHAARGMYYMGASTVVNASVVDEFYRLVEDPVVYLDL